MPKTEVEAEKISTKLHQEALQHIPGGVNSSTRALNPPIIWGGAQGSKLISVDGREYLDYHAAFGPNLLGHNHSIVNRAVAESLEGPDLAGVGTTEAEIRSRKKFRAVFRPLRRRCFASAGRKLLSTQFAWRGRLPAARS